MIVVRVCADKDMERYVNDKWNGLGDIEKSGTEKSSLNDRNM